MTAPSVDWARELADQLTFHWDAFLRPRLDGLTDDEVHWPPVDAAWDVHPEP